MPRKQPGILFVAQTHAFSLENHEKWRFFRNYSGLLKIQIILDFKKNS